MNVRILFKKFGSETYDDDYGGNCGDAAKWVIKFLSFLCFILVFFV